MKKIFFELIVSILIVFVIVASLIGMFYVLMPNQYETNYVSAMWDKYQRLITIDGPKVVLIGDSNLAFGCDSEYIEEQLGIPVVNMGLHGGLGNDVQTRLAMANVQEGDIYVICYTDYNQDSELSQKDLTLIMLSNHWDMWNQLSFSQRVGLISAIPDYMFNSLSLFLSRRGNLPLEPQYRDYAHESFNEYGDMCVRIEGNANYDFEDYESKCGGISKKTISDLKKWNGYCEERGAELVLAGWPIAITEKMDSKDDFEVWRSDLEEKTGCKIISIYEDYFFDQDLFYDSVFHLTRDGAKYRSRILIEDIFRFENRP